MQLLHQSVDIGLSPAALAHHLRERGHLRALAGSLNESARKDLLLLGAQHATARLAEQWIGSHGELTTAIRELHAVPVADSQAQFCQGSLRLVTRRIEQERRGEARRRLHFVGSNWPGRESSL